MSVVESLIEIRDGYLSELALDAVKPKPNYSLDGQAVDRNAWRLGLFKIIAEINDLVQMTQPYELRGNGL